MISIIIISENIKRIMLMVSILIIYYVRTYSVLERSITMVILIIFSGLKSSMMIMMIIMMIIKKIIYYDYDD